MQTQDQYQFFLDKGPLKNLKSYFDFDTSNNTLVDDFFYKEIIEHPNYDAVWQKKGIIQHLNKVPSSVATMIVGGWFDAEDLYGPLETYKGIEKHQPNNYNTLVFGPWDHGGWSRDKTKKHSR